MNLVRYLLPTFSSVSKSTAAFIHPRLSQSRTFSSLTFGRQTGLFQNVTHTLPTAVSQAPFIQVSQPCRTYKHKDVLKRRCPGCYFVKKFGILHVECDLKPRHKQVQKMRGNMVYKDDYSTGKWRSAIHWGWKKRAFYKLANEKYVKYDWLDGKIGTKI